MRLTSAHKATSSNPTGQPRTADIGTLDRHYLVDMEMAYLDRIAHD
ncbi:MAG: hypothetical protein WBC82_11045 [Dehalococcoidia bacterium]